MRYMQSRNELSLVLETRRRYGQRDPGWEQWLKLPGEMHVVCYPQSAARGLAQAAPIPSGANRALVVKGTVDSSIDRPRSRTSSPSQAQPPS